MFDSTKTTEHYTIPSNNRELRLIVAVIMARLNYTIPSNNRELRRKNLAN